MLSVVIPTWNEEQRIPATLEKVDSYLQKLGQKAEIIIVDDGSTDQTIAKIQALTVATPLRVIASTPNQGKGRAVQQGMLVATGQFVLFMDADNSTDLSEWDRFRTYFANGADVVIASRYVKDSVVAQKQPWYRVFLARVANLLIRIVLLPGIADTQCGFKAFRGDVAKKLFAAQTIPRWGFDMEILFLARRLHYKIIEAPVTWTEMQGTRIRFWKDSLRTFAELYKIRLNALRGKYQLT